MKYYYTDLYKINNLLKDFSVRKTEIEDIKKKYKDDNIRSLILIISTIIEFNINNKLEEINVKEKTLSEMIKIIKKRKEK